MRREQGFIQSIEFAAVLGIHHGFSTRKLSNSTHIYCDREDHKTDLDKLSNIRHNRQVAMQAFGAAEEQLCILHQIHSNLVVQVIEPWQVTKEPKADAMVTAIPGIVLGIMTADCTPVLFVDPVAKVIGAAHAGWKGARHGILEETIAAMLKLGAHRANIIVAIGPTIAQGSYEVGPEFHQSFIQEADQNTRFFIPSIKAEHYMFDLPAYVIGKLTAAGLKQIHNIGLDTYQEKEYFPSYRRSTITKEAYNGNSILSVLTLL